MTNTILQPLKKCDRTHYLEILSNRVAEWLAVDRRVAAGVSVSRTELTIRKLLLDQAIHLLTQGDSEELSAGERYLQYGNDEQIAKLLSQLLAPMVSIKSCLSGESEASLWDDVLWQIAISFRHDINYPLNETERSCMIQFLEKRFGIQLHYLGGEEGALCMK